jgi:hypothetical protein
MISMNLKNKTKSVGGELNFLNPDPFSLGCNFGREQVSSNFKNVKKENCSLIMLW